VPLGHVLAETGRLREAAALFETLSGRDLLTEAGYAALTSWYVSLGLDEDARRTRFRRYRRLDEHRLSRHIRDAERRLRRRRREEAMGDLDPDVLLMIRALLGKAKHVENHLHTVQSLYRATKDVRVLASLADALVGHTTERTYGALERSWRIVREIHEEATCDAIAERLAERRKGPDVDATDRRALLLLEAMVERRAAEVLNEPGPHVERALAALKESFPTMWRTGERRLLAKFLAALGRIPDERLAAEQLSQLERILRFEPRGTADRLPIAFSLAETRWVYAQREEAVDGLEAALAEVRESAGGALPPTAREKAGRLVAWLTDMNHFARAETYVFAERERQSKKGEQLAYSRMLHPLYLSCLREGGTVSLGTGAALYAAARKVLEEAMLNDEPGQVTQAIQWSCHLHEEAARKPEIATAGEDLERFARDRLPEVLARATGDTRHIVLSLANSLSRIRSTRSALALLVARLEAVPEGRTAQPEAWAAWCRNMAAWRHRTPDLGDLEPRLLAVVLRELDHDLVSLRSRGRYIYAPGHKHYFWKAKSADFLAIARKVIEVHAEWPNRVVRAAEYLWGPLDRREEAVRTLLSADELGKLTPPGRSVLVDWLLHDKQHADALAHVSKLVEVEPDQIRHRLRQMTALHALGRPDEAGAVSDATRERFVAMERWNEHVGRSLARHCLDCDLFERSAALYEEAIRSYERKLRSSGSYGRNTWLGDAYAHMASALASLGRLDEAMDAACAAVVASGRTHALRQTLKTMDDLDAYVARWDARVEESGLDSAAIRGALGQAYADRKDHARAAAQAEIACLLRPEDPEVHGQLVRALDRMKDAEGACRALARAIRQAPGDLSRYLDLAGRYDRMKRPGEAARARTGLVEEKPNEAEGHRKLALLLMRQKRYEDAVVHYRQVVRIRSLEPDGWLDLAEALIKAKRLDEARQTLEHVLKVKWDRRHGKVLERTSRILRKIPDGD
jgi:tetratricopeptide (TPR) repeat protein